MAPSTSTDLRAAFARRLSDMYGGEVPAYTTLVEVAHEGNAEVLEREGSAAERLRRNHPGTPEGGRADPGGRPARPRAGGPGFSPVGGRPGGRVHPRGAPPA